MLSLSYIEEVVEEQNEELRETRLLPREVLGEVERSLALEEITVLLGPRRSGKTSVMGLLLQRHPEALYVNMEDERLHGFSVEDFRLLEEVAKKIGKRIIMLDEVQQVAGWERFAHRAHKRYKLVVSGSNASLLRAELSRALTGRTKTVEVMPLSFREFLAFRGWKAERAALLAYMETGGFPRVVLSGDKSLLREYLDAIIYRDVVGRAAVKHPEEIRELAVYLLANVGKEFSYRRIAHTFGLDEKTVKHYIHLLEEAFLLFTMRRFDVSLRRQERYNKKVYGVDTGLAAAVPRIEDKGRLFENAFFLHLRRAWQDSLYFYRGQREVDFLLCRGLKPAIAINVAFEIREEGTLKREWAGLKEVRRRFKGIETHLIAAMPTPYEGVENALPYLTGERKLGPS